MKFSTMNLFFFTNKLSRMKLSVIFTIVLGYSSYYVCRLNFAFSIPFLISEYNYSKSQIGTLLTIFAIVYGVNKFVSGILSDLFQPSKIIIIGLVGTGITNLTIPYFSDCLPVLWVVFLFNALFQSLGWPPCVKLINRYFDKNEIGTVWGLCNSSHAIGGAAAALLCCYFATYFGWRYIFYVPAIVAIVMAVFMSTILDKPTPHTREKNVGYNPYLRNYLKSINQLIRNPLVWFMCMSNLFLYVVRVGILNWLPIFLVEYKNMSLSMVSLQFSGFEFSGIVGGIVAGFLSDQFHIRNRCIVALIFSFCLILCISMMMIIPESFIYLFCINIYFLGFFIYGPQILGGIIANDCVPVKISAATTGLVGMFGYIGGAFSGVGLGFIADIFGWEGVFFCLTFSTFLIFIFFLLARFFRVRLWEEPREVTLPQDRLA